MYKAFSNFYNQNKLIKNKIMVKKILSTLFVTSILSSNIAQAYQSHMEPAPANYYSQGNTIVRTNVVDTMAEMAMEDDQIVFVKFLYNNSSLFNISEKYSALADKDTIMSISTSAVEPNGIKDNVFNWCSGGISLGWALSENLAIGVEGKMEQRMVKFSVDKKYKNSYGEDVKSPSKKTNKSLVAFLEFAPMDSEDTVYFGISGKAGMEFDNDTDFKYGESKDSEEKFETQKKYENLINDKGRMFGIVGASVMIGIQPFPAVSVEFRGGVDLKFPYDKNREVEIEKEKYKTENELGFLNPYLGLALKFSGNIK